MNPILRKKSKLLGKLESTPGAFEPLTAEDAVIRIAGPGPKTFGVTFSLEDGIPESFMEQSGQYQFDISSAGALRVTLPNGKVEFWTRP